MFKYIGLLLKFRDITDAYCEEKGKNPSIFMSKRVIGATMALFFGALDAYGIQWDQMSKDYLMQNAQNLIPQIAALGLTLYGVALAIVGMFQSAKRGKPNCEPKPKEGGIV
jgi:hypothetical protein